MRETDASKANDALREVAKLRDTVKTLERRCEKQAAVIRAICQLMFDKVSVIEPELLATIAKIENDRATNAVKDCGQCQRPLKLNSRKCIYCAYEVPVQSVFDLI